MLLFVIELIYGVFISNTKHLYKNCGHIWGKKFPE